ncbi:MAG: GNAT family N-acetyltransferase [Treponema sp.]|jgi:GNAT superfamily N-acetyltransferase|nr:GNAT family N-acetyltransferase [Treponema sp.]
MSASIVITENNAGKYFRLMRLDASASITAFECRIGEYTDYLKEEALRAQVDHVAITWLLLEETSGEIAAYMSLITDAVKLSTAEKELHRLDYPFKTIPAIKIGKLAVCEAFRQRYRGLGRLMIYQAAQIATDNVNDYCAARFLTVDADIEHDPGVLAFYEKTGFVPNTELSGKHRKTLSMRLDLYA